MNKYQTNFIRRYFNNDIINSGFGIGLVCSDDIPAFLYTDMSSYYNCSLILSNSNTKEVSISSSYQPGDVFQFFPEKGKEQHGLSSLLLSLPSGVTFLHICFNNSTYHALSSCSLLLSDTFFHITLESYLHSWIPALIQQLKNTPQEDLSEVYLNMQKFLINLHRPLINATTNNRQIIESAKQLLFDSCLRDVPMPEIAASVGLGYENFRKIFKEETGISPLQYVLDCKFHYAERLLTEGMSVKETAVAVGYADPYIFSKQFKKYTGISPSHYKKSSSLP